LAGGGDGQTLAVLWSGKFNESTFVFEGGIGKKNVH